MIKLKFLIAATLLSAASFSYAAVANTACTDSSRECVISVATTYIDALVSHDPSNVPLADNAERWENGVNTGANGEAIREGLKNDYRFKVIEGVRNVQWMVDGNQAIAYYLLDTYIPHTTIHTATTHIAERFVVNNGKIDEIEAIFCTSMGTSPESNKITASNPPSILCNRSWL